MFNMFKKIIAYPNGIIKYYYTDKIVVENKNGVPVITQRTYNERETHGIFGVPSMVRHNFGEFSFYIHILC